MGKWKDMMDIFYVVFVSIAFTGYAILDIFSLAVRVSGALVNANAVGSSYEKMINTIKRVFIVVYPPVLGILLVKKSYYVIFLCITFSYIGAGLACLLIALNQKFIISYFIGVIYKFRSHPNTIMSFASNPFKKVDANTIDEFNWGRGIVSSLLIEKKLTFSYIWVGFIYSSSVFLINSMAIIFSKYNTIILQMIGFYSALGTVLLSFLIDPRISSNLDCKSGLDTVLNRMIYCQIIIYLVVSPVFFVTLYVFLIFDIMVS